VQNLGYRRNPRVLKIFGDSSTVTRWLSHC
jgi:hypothetical protein